jgi:hypothetical protein
MKLRQLLLLTFLAFFGCSSRHEYIYRYGEVSITRVDEPGHSYFYWGTRTDQSVAPDVSVDYHEYGSLLDGYLVFNPDKSVSIIGVEGYFQTTGSQHPVALLHPPNERFVSWHDSLAGRYRNVVRLISEEDMERRENAANKSTVSVSVRE